jgi:HMG (high mobility group) box
MEANQQNVLPEESKDVHISNPTQNPVSSDERNDKIQNAIDPTTTTDASTTVHDNTRTENDGNKSYSDANLGLYSGSGASSTSQGSNVLATTLQNQQQQLLYHHPQLNLPTGSIMMHQHPQQQQHQQFIFPSNPSQNNHLMMHTMNTQTPILIHTQTPTIDQNQQDVKLQDYHSQNMMNQQQQQQQQQQGHISNVTFLQQQQQQQQRSYPSSTTADEDNRRNWNAANIATVNNNNLNQMMFYNPTATMGMMPSQPFFFPSPQNGNMSSISSTATNTGAPGASASQMTAGGGAGGGFILAAAAAASANPMMNPAAAFYVPHMLHPMMAAQSHHQAQGFPMPVLLQVNPHHQLQNAQQQHQQQQQQQHSQQMLNSMGTMLRMDGNNNNFPTMMANHINLHGNSNNGNSNNNVNSSNPNSHSGSDIPTSTLTSNSISILPSNISKRSAAIEGQPIRPLSAYNFFFADEREKVLKEAEDGEVEVQQQKEENTNDDIVVTIQNPPPIVTKIEEVTSSATPEADTSPKAPIVLSRDEIIIPTDTLVDDKDGTIQTVATTTSVSQRIVPDGVESFEEMKTRLLGMHLHKDRSKRRPHRKTHGRIGFTELSKIVGQRWKELPEERKQKYRIIAAADLERYQKEVAEFNNARLTKRQKP